MDNQQIVIRAYDAIHPLAAGLVTAGDLNITVDSHSSIDVMSSADPPECGEMSLSKYVRGLAAGDDRWVGMPYFVIRGFRQRSFWTGNDSGLGGFADLRGRTVGLSGWPDSGNVWSRSLITHAGVPLTDVDWRVGKVTNDYPREVAVPSAPGLNVTGLAEGDSLVDAAIGGRLDVVALAFPPEFLFHADSPLRRLCADPRGEERAYFEATSVYPILHIVALRRDVFDRHPDRLAAIYEALCRSWQMRHQLVRTFGDSTPWMQLDLEASADLLGTSDRPFDHTAPINARTLREFCSQLQEQNLLPQPIDPDLLFADFDSITTAARR